MPAGAQEHRGHPEHQERLGQVSPASVLVVKNTLSPDSKAIADYYVRKRHIPAANVCTIACSVGEECKLQEYTDLIETPIKSFLAKLDHEIDYIVLTHGIPIRTTEGSSGGWSVDSVLAAFEVRSRIPNLARYTNPYYNKTGRFTHARYHFYLVTRLEGYTRTDCLRLVDNSLAARPHSGPFLIHVGPGHEDGGYRAVNEGMRHAYEILEGRHLNATLSVGPEFAGGIKHLMGYFSWGSNDAKFDKAAYRSLGFDPGAIAETAVSTSGRTFDNPEAPGQSLIGDLIRQGVTGCKGYVSEPFADSIACADILFDRYTAGYDLAESFYAASRFLHWKDLVIGDPLCAPYAAN
jgi:uncharacterized protein (TIGR03790 family)